MPMLATFSNDKYLKKDTKKWFNKTNYFYLKSCHNMLGDDSFSHKEYFLQIEIENLSN